MTAWDLVLRYVLFALLATGVNVAPQHLSLGVYAGRYGLGLAIGAGLVTKYILDRRWIFEDKTPIVDATQASFNFLGFTIQMSRGASTGEPYPNVRPGDKSLKKIKARLTELTGRKLTAISLGESWEA